ncbi:MAG: hypothetical protein Q9173_005565 [Seirophora scorigena]
MESALSCGSSLGIIRLPSLATSAFTLLQPVFARACHSDYRHGPEPPLPSPTPHISVSLPTPNTREPAPSNPDDMSNPNGGSLPPNAYLPDPPDFHAPSSLGREIGVMFAFLSLFPLGLIIYYYAWRWANRRESDAEWLRLERLASKGFGVMPEMPRRPVAARKGLMAVRSENRGWRDRWRWSGMASEGPGGQVATTMVMSTGAGHGGGELP